jgi:hypothetical protein
MKNLAANEGMQDKLKEMHGIYDDYLEKWKSECVDGNNYPKYGVLFDRNIAWEEKAGILSK